MKPTVYLETTIISYLAARPSRDLIVAANQQITHEWWNNHRHKYQLFISPLVVQEISAGDTNASAQRLALVEGIDALDLTEQAVLLAESLTGQGVIPSAKLEDALHIAIAAVAEIDYLLTWNIKHIANAALRSRIEELCRIAGYKPPIIYSPYEFLLVGD